MRLLVRLLLIVTAAGVVSGSCPHVPAGCRCGGDTDTGWASCDGVQLLEFPIFFNPKIKKLSLRGCRLTSLDGTSLGIYTELEDLDVSNNSITFLKANLFENLNKLRVLSLKNNRLTLLSSATLRPLYNLQNLDVSSNQIHSIEPGTFDSLSSLVKLNLKNNVIPSLDSRLFEKTRHLMELNLSYNQITEVDSDVFCTLANLSHLDLSHNKVEKIWEFAFENCLSLRVIDIGHNMLKKLDENAFTGAKIRQMNLKHNQLDENSFAAIRKVPDLVKLDLSWNNFAEISTSSLDRLAHLQTLFLTDELNLRKVELNAFSGLPKLKTLNMSRCSKLYEINEGAFEYSDELRELDLSHCNIRKLHASLIQWTKLTKLELMGNDFDCDCSLLSFFPPILKRLNSKVTCAMPARLARHRIADLGGYCTEWRSESKLTIVVALLLFVASAILIIICYQRRSPKRSSARMPGCSQSFIVTPLPYEKNYEISRSSLSCLRRYDAMLPGRMAPEEDRDDEGESYYSSLILPSEDSLSLRLPSSPAKPVPPPETTIPQRPCIYIPPLMNQSFRIISNYPIPITEL